jgi:membrane-anchored protein YejM (alkaline phosphatase superfamily)
MSCDAAIRLMQAVLAPERLSSLLSRTLKSIFVHELFFLFFFLFLAGQNIFACLSAHQNDVRTSHFFTTTTTLTLTSATLSLMGYHLHVLLIDFYSSHNIYAITMLQLWRDISSSNSNFNLFSSLTVCGAPAVTAEDVRVYLVDYILCIIDYHIRNKRVVVQL